MFFHPKCFISAEHSKELIVIFNMDEVFKILFNYLYKYINNKFNDFFTILHKKKKLLIKNKKYQRLILSIFVIIKH